MSIRSEECGDALEHLADVVSLALVLLRLSVIGDALQCFGVGLAAVADREYSDITVFVVVLDLVDELSQLTCILRDIRRIASVCSEVGTC